MNAKIEEYKYNMWLASKSAQGKGTYKMYSSIKSFKILLNGDGEKEQRDT